jgi:hypothetical protein
MAGADGPRRAKADVGSKQTSIVDLPPEIISKVDFAQKDLVSLVLISKRFYKVFISELYHSVNIRGEHEDNSIDAVVKFLRTIISKPQLAEHVKQLHPVEYGWSRCLRGRTIKLDQTNARIPNAQFSASAEAHYARVTHQNVTKFLLSNLPNLFHLDLCHSDYEQTPYFPTFDRHIFIRKLLNLFRSPNSCHYHFLKVFLWALSAQSSTPLAFS